MEYYNETKILFDIIFKPLPLIWNQRDLNWCEKKQIKIYKYIKIFCIYNAI